MQKLRQDKNLGTNIRSVRKRCRLTQEQVAAKLQLMGCDITRSTYSRYETGELNIKTSEIIALKRIFRCSYDELFEGLEEQE